jgi:hypothetical protein
MEQTEQGMLHWTGPTASFVTIAERLDAAVTTADGPPVVAPESADSRLAAVRPF